MCYLSIIFINVHFSLFTMGIRIRDVKKVLKDMGKWNFPDVEKKHIYKFVDEFRAGRITGRIGKDIEGSIESVLYQLKLPMEYWNKNLDGLTEEDAKDFFDALMSNKLKKKVRKNVIVKGKKVLMAVDLGNYEMSGKKKFIKALLLYLKFRFDSEPEKLARFNKIFKIIITSVELEPESLSEAEYEQLYEASGELWQKFFHEVNVWGGMRAGEFHSLIESDFILPDLAKNENFVRVQIRNSTSKTKGRIVTLYGKNCYKVVKAYLDKRKLEGLKHNEPVFEKSYNATKIWLRRFGKKVLKKELHHHLYRSTSATWITDKKIISEKTRLCLFFGWKFSSPMPDVYINRSKIEMDEPDIRVKNTELEELRSKLEGENQKKTIELENLNKKFDFFSRIAKAILEYMPEEERKKLIPVRMTPEEQKLFLKNTDGK